MPILTPPLLLRKTVVVLIIGPILTMPGCVSDSDKPLPSKSSDSPETIRQNDDNSSGPGLSDPGRISRVWETAAGELIFGSDEEFLHQSTDPQDQSLAPNRPEMPVTDQD